MGPDALHFSPLGQAISIALILAVLISVLYYSNYILPKQPTFFDSLKPVESICQQAMTASECNAQPDPRIVELVQQKKFQFQCAWDAETNRCRLCWLDASYQKCGSFVFP